MRSMSNMTPSSCSVHPMQLGDAATTTISALVCVATEIESWLPNAVADARDQDYPWDAIATRLATTAATAQRRYAGHARTRTPSSDIVPRKLEWAAPPPAVDTGPSSAAGRGRTEPDLPDAQAACHQPVPPS
jgi:hypothetical protein